MTSPILTNNLGDSHPCLQTHIPIGTLIALNGLYDLAASNILDGQACTSVIAQARATCHIRKVAHRRCAAHLPY